MKKKLIVFCDGTWNSADQKTKDDRPCPTNVLRMLQATQERSQGGDPQIVHYIAGVGTKFSERVWGGGFGFGISENIRNAYSFIVSNYDDGDEIFLLGFSRGAFTARSIAGFIRNMGILRRDRLNLVGEAYDHYRDTGDKWHPDSKESAAFRAANAHPDATTNIAFLGVWDTVGALGAPFGVVMSRLTDTLFHTRFHDVRLSSIILSAYHALAIDERRWPFRPTLWELNDAHKQRIADACARGEISPYEERWFPGVHSNVGGGYPESGLADCALAWMIDRAGHHGLNFDTSDISLPTYKMDCTVDLEDSQTWYYRLLTFLFVYLQRPWLRNKGDPKDRVLLDFVRPNGDFLRPVRNQGELLAALKAFPELAGYEGEIADYAIERMCKIKDYRPSNVTWG